MKALLAKANLNLILKSKMVKFIKEAKITETMLKNIDNPNDGTGSMILVRVLCKWEGRILVNTLKDVRNALGLGNRFCVSLDCDDDTSSREKLDLCETQFLPRLQAWNGGGNKEYKPTFYTDLKDLPVILVVVEKGKMGITYPKSLRYYDLRLRYATTAGVTRGAIEQDFGRACRYKCDGDPPLPTVIVSQAAEKQLLDHDFRYLRQGRFKPSGVYKLRPDYQIYMKPSEQGGKDDFPNDESNLLPYQRWTACGKHWDAGNTEFLDNRYLLVGRPQIGKTGVFLHLALLLWRAAGSPKFTSPTFEEVDIELPKTDEDDDELIHSPSRDNMEPFPDFNAMKELTLEKCPKSSRYGDPNDEKVRRHYLEEGNQYPYPGALQGGQNTLMKRKMNVERRVNSGGADREIESKPTDNVRTVPTRVNAQFSSKAISGAIPETKDLTKEYEKLPIPGLGLLYLRKSGKFAAKWDLRKGEMTSPTLKTKIKLPPILIPSSGRSKTALLDLTDAMEGKEDFVEIVVVRHEEQDEYLKTAFLHPALDVFVMDASRHNTVGEARMVAKKLGEQITKGTKMNFVFILDDNILCWQGVTLINDPYPQFGLEADHKTSQRTDISLYKVLSHFSSNSSVEDFNMIGFSIGSHKSITKRKLAYGRKHVMAAVLLNLGKSKGIEYNPKAWAMEDIDFNLRTDELSSKHHDQGVIVKCLRFVASKKRIGEGGVVPCDVPKDVMKMMEETEELSGVGQRKKPVEHTGKEERGEKSKGMQHAEKGNHIRSLFRTENSHINDNLEQSEEEKRQLIEHLKAQKAEATRERMKTEKELEERKKAEADIVASLAALTGESIPPQGTVSKKKRPQRESVDADMEKKLTDAEESNLLPEGLVKQNGTKVNCNKPDCDDCSYIPKPFHHFVMNNSGKKCVCHMCQLYESEDLFSVLAKIYAAKKLQSKSKKTKR